MRAAVASLLFAAALTGASALPAAAAQYTIVLDKMKFGPVPTELHVGDKIIWQNNDIFWHSATARDKSFDLDLPPKAEATLELKTPGNIDFYCKFHPGMIGTLVVQP